MIKSTFWFFYYWYHLGTEDTTEVTFLAEKKDEDGERDFELPFFNFATIVEGTNDFSNDNKLGEGGFGPVYKVNMQLLG